MRGADELLRHEVQPHERRAVRHHLLLLLAPRLDVPPLPRRHEPDEPRALPLRDPSRNGLRILALLLRNGRGDRLRRRRLRRAFRPLAPRHRAGARQRLEKGNLARPARRGKNDVDDHARAKFEDELARRHWNTSRGRASAPCIDSTHRTHHERRHNATVPADPPPESRSRASPSVPSPRPARRHLRPFARTSGDGSLLYVTTVPSRLNPAGSACHPIPAYRPSACATHRPYM